MHYSTSRLVFLVSLTSLLSTALAQPARGHGKPRSWQYTNQAQSTVSSLNGPAPSADTSLYTTAPAPATLPASVVPSPAAPSVPEAQATSSAAASVAQTTYAQPPTSLTSAQSVGSTGGASTSGDTTSYKQYLGDGSSSMGWPTLDKWVSYEELWSANQKLMDVGCDYWKVPNPSSDEKDLLDAAISKKSTESGVDKRFILAIVMQESNGCPRAPTTRFAVDNTGLCQSHEGKGTCNSGTLVQTPCPADMIELMIDDGVQGPDTQGYNLKDKLASANGEITADGLKAADQPAFAYYLAAAEYNGGSRPPSKKLEDNIATKCYASDIANRLLGWVSLTGTQCTIGK